jgi:hypothetical protein
MVRHEDLEAWLVANGIDEVRGYGHICATDLAERMQQAMEMDWHEGHGTNHPPTSTG